MAVLQQSIKELRYIKRHNLEQEAKLVGNMYRDQVHAYGIDCLYYKLDKSLFSTYTNIVNENNILLHAYGYNHAPTYSLSTDMIVYMDVQNDVFNLNKYGIIPNTDVTFVFDRLDFACSLAPKFGRYKEYTLSSIQLDFSDKPSFPFKIHQTIFQKIGFTTMSAEISASLEDLTPGIHETSCDIIGKGFANTSFPVNDDIYSSFMHTMLQEDSLLTMMKIKYEVKNSNIEKYDVTGEINGSFLFFDLAALNKYYELLHPDVGDIITIDFPDKASREQYEITEAIDKSLVSDGVNPLLHKYIWKCKARRYINTYENMENNEANEQLEEQLKYDASVAEELTKKISVYKDNEDDVYGSYDNPNAVSYDKQELHPKQNNQPQIPIGMLECVATFAAGSKLATDGFDLWFITNTGNANQLSLNEIKNKDSNLNVGPQQIQWLKANDDNIVFNTLDGKSFMLAFNENALPDQQQICLDSLFDLTKEIGKPINAPNQNFFKFKNTRTILFATADHLFCHLANRKTYILA